MRPGLSAARAVDLAVVLLAALVASTCGGEREVTGPDPAPLAAAARSSDDADGDVTAAGGDKAEVCHLSGNGQYKLMSLSPNALASHLGHGDLPVATRFADSDRDGFGGGKCPASTTSPFALQGGDCNDSSAAVNPGAIDNSPNSIDNDCDGDVDEDICPCAQPYPGQNWVDRRLAYDLSQNSVTPSVCGSLLYVTEDFASLRIALSPGGTDFTRVWVMPGTGTNGRCGLVKELFAGGSVSVSSETTAVLSGVAACHAQILASEVYRQSCGS